MNETRRNEKRREAAIDAWFHYCNQMRVPPRHLLGRRYPGYEDQPMTVEMVVEVERLMEAAE